MGRFDREEQPEEAERPLKKLTRSEAADKWGHDMFDPDQQGPKANDELVALYGYDIRQEEGAPRARRRRRYGRGPNKYDRTWEDEEAYSRPSPRGGGRGGGGPPRGGRSQQTPRKEDFPALPGQQNQPPHQPAREFRGGEESAAINPSVQPFPSSAGPRRDGGNRQPRGERNERSEGGGKPNASAISFRRGGGGRTFEERNKVRWPVSRSTFVCL